MEISDSCFLLAYAFMFKEFLDFFNELFFVFLFMAIKFLSGMPDSIREDQPQFMEGIFFTFDGRKYHRLLVNQLS